MSKRIHIVFSLILIIILIFIAGITTVIPQMIVMILLIGLYTIFLCFINQEVAAVILILSMVISPEIIVSNVGLRPASIRLDDIILIVFFFSWLFKMAFTKQINTNTSTSLIKPYLTYVFVAIFCSYYAYITRGNIIPISAALHILKYLEYLMIYLVFTSITTTKTQLYRYLRTLFFGAFVISIYGFYQIFISISRISAPFEGKGEANTLGGYFLVILGQTWISMLISKKTTHKLYSFFASTAILILILHTQSRTTYFSVGALYLCSFFVLSKKRQIQLMIISIVLCIFLPSLLPKKFVDRITSPFEGNAKTYIPGLKVDPRDSLYARLSYTERTFITWQSHTLLGSGVTGSGIVDVQYFRTLGEMGLVGLTVFFWLLYSIFGAIKKTRSLLTLYDPEYVLPYRIIVLGLLCSYFGLLVHSLGANTFIIIRIMEPFWFLVAIVVKIPDIIENDNSGTDEISKYSNAYTNN